LADRELKFIYREPDNKGSSCGEVAGAVVLIIVIFGFMALRFSLWSLR